MDKKQIAKMYVDFNEYHAMAPNWEWFADSEEDAVDQVAEWLADGGYVSEFQLEVASAMSVGPHDPDYTALGVALIRALLIVELANKIRDFWDVDGYEVEDLDDFLFGIENHPEALADNIMRELKENEPTPERLNLANDCMDCLGALL